MKQQKMIRKRKYYSPSLSSSFSNVALFLFTMMIAALALSSVGVGVVVVVVNAQQLTTTMTEFWKLQDPIWEYGGNTFELNYKFNDLVEHTMIRYSFYDKNCQLGGNEIPIMGSDAGYTIAITNDGQPTGDGSSTRSYKVAFQPTSTINENSVIYDGDYYQQQDDTTTTTTTTSSGGGDYFAYVELCARVSLYTEQGIEVNFLESIMKIQYLFTDGAVSIADVNVQRPLLDLTNVELGVKLRAYDCTLSSGGSTTGAATFLSQGQVIRVCIEPIQEAVLDGFRMKAIEWFTYMKPSQNVTQQAVIDREASPNDLTRLTCLQGTAQCIVETMLVGDFFAGNGTVEAAGLATMQLGTHSSSSTERRRRRSLLRSNSKSRSGSNVINIVGNNNNNRILQQAADTISKEFDIPFEVISNADSITATTASDAVATYSLDRNSGGGGSQMVSIIILVLILINIGTLLVLMFQHKVFQRTWFYMME